MQSFDVKKLYSFRADANALGGFLEEPFEKILPTLAPVSLPAVGGFASARSGAFNLDEIVSCSAAYTRVSGKQHNANGSISILVAAVVENLNILEVVTAERIVAQASITIEDDGGPCISFAGSRFDGLRVAGCENKPDLNPDLNGGLALTRADIQKAGQAQAKRLIDCFKAGGDEDAYEWALKRHGWMTEEPPQEDGRTILCSLVDGFGANSANGARGHIVEIPGFGRIIIGEVFVSRESIQLVAIRAELGCPVAGKISVCCSGGGGAHP